MSFYNKLPFQLSANVHPSRTCYYCGEGAFVWLESNHGPSWYDETVLAVKQPRHSTCKCVGANASLKALESSEMFTVRGVMGYHTGSNLRMQFRKKKKERERKKNLV